MRKIHIRQTTTTRATDAEQSTSGEGSGKRQKRDFKEENREFSVVNARVFPPPQLFFLCLRLSGVVWRKKGRRSYDNRKGYETFSLSLACTYIFSLASSRSLEFSALSTAFCHPHCRCLALPPLELSAAQQRGKLSLISGEKVCRRPFSDLPHHCSLSFLIVNIKRRSGVDSRVRVG